MQDTKPNETLKRWAAQDNTLTSEAQKILDDILRDAITAYMEIIAQHPNTITL